MEEPNSAVLGLTMKMKALSKQQIMSLNIKYIKVCLEAFRVPEINTPNFVKIKMTILRLKKAVIKFKTFASVSLDITYANASNKLDDQKWREAYSYQLARFNNLSGELLLIFSVLNTNSFFPKKARTHKLSPLFFHFLHPPVRSR